MVLVDEPFAGLTQAEVAAFSELIDGFRRDGRAVLLVDHNVKSVAALVDRVLAMYLGERIAEGTAEQVMRDETVRRVYLGGTIEAHPRKELDARGGEALLDVRDVDVFYGKAQALQKVSIHVNAGEFVSVVGLNGAGQDDACSTRSPAWCRYGGRHPLGRRSAAPGARRRRSRAAGSCSARKRASCSAS